MTTATPTAPDGAPSDVNIPPLRRTAASIRAGHPVDPHRDPPRRTKDRATGSDRKTDIPLDWVGRDDGKQDGTQRLSPRERETLLLVAHGMSDSDISRVLSISRRTVGAHMRNLRKKLCAKNRTHLVARALRAGILAIRTERPFPPTGEDETFHLTGREGVQRPADSPAP